MMIDGFWMIERRRAWVESSIFRRGLVLGNRAELQNLPGIGCRHVA